MADNPTSRKLNNDPVSLRLQEGLTLPFGSSTRQVAPQGSVIYDNLSSDTPQVYFSDGTEWKTLGGGGVEVVPDVTLEPVGPEGTIVYNEADDNLYYSNGVAWVLVESGGSGDTLATVLTNGNTTGATNLIADSGDIVINDGQELTLGTAGRVQGDDASTSIDLENAAGTSFFRVEGGAGESTLIRTTGVNTIESSGAFDPAIDMNASAGGIRMTAAIASATAIRLNAPNGGIDIDASGTIDIDSTGLIDIDAAGQINIASSSAFADALILRSTVSGMKLDANGLITVIAAGGFDLNTAFADPQAILLNATAGGIDILAFQNAQVQSSNTTTDAVKLNATAGGIEVDASDKVRLIAGEETVVEERLATAGSPPTAALGTVAADSTSVAGRVTVWDSNTNNNNIITFAAPFSSGTPIVMLTPLDANSAAAGLHISSTGVNSFTASTSGNFNNVGFYYHVICMQT